MSLQPLSTVSSGGFTLIDAGIHNAVCASIIDHGMVAGSYKGVANNLHKISIIFQTEAQNGDQGPHTLIKEFTYSLGESGKLRPFLEAWRGKKFEAIETFDIMKLLGASCTLIVAHDTIKSGRNQGKPRAFIQSVTKAQKKINPSDVYLWEGLKTKGTYYEAVFAPGIKQKEVVRIQTAPTQTVVVQSPVKQQDPFGNLDVPQVNPVQAYAQQVAAQAKVLQPVQVMETVPADDPDDLPF